MLPQNNIKQNKQQQQKKPRNEAKRRRKRRQKRKRRKRKRPPPQVSGLVTHAGNPGTRKAETEEVPKFETSLNYIAISRSGQPRPNIRPNLK